MYWMRLSFHLIHVLLDLQCCILIPHNQNANLRGRFSHYKPQVLRLLKDPANYIPPSISFQTRRGKKAWSRLNRVPIWRLHFEHIAKKYHDKKKKVKARPTFVTIFYVQYHKWVLKERRKTTINVFLESIRVSPLNLNICIKNLKTFIILIGLYYSAFLAFLYIIRSNFQLCKLFS